MKRRRKHEQYADAARKTREEWRLSQLQRCMFCGAVPSWLPLAVHEIERRSHAPTRWAAKCNYLLLCEPCHAGPFATMPHARQLAVKLVADSTHFDLQAWLRLKDPLLAAPDRVTASEIKDLAMLFATNPEAFRA